MAEMDDQELFSSAIADDSTSEVTEHPTAQQEEATPTQDDRPRDEHGRFAPKQAEPEPQPEPIAAQEQPQATEEGHIPPWRLREIREERDALRQQYLDAQRQIEMLRQSQPKPEPKPAPDLFEDPDGRIDHRLQQGLSPLEQRVQAAEARMQAQLEYTSRRDAIREHGPDLVREAYDWLGKGIQARDPDVVHAYNRVMQSEHPFDAAVQSYKRTSLMQQISQVGDIDKWVMQRAQELAGQQQSSQQSKPSSQQPQGSNIKLPPTLRSVPSARSAAEDDTDMSDAALFRYATR